MNSAHRNASRAKRQRHPGEASTSTIEDTLKAVALVSPRDREEVFAPMRAARKALQFGGFNKTSWADLADAFNLAEAMMSPGIRLAPDHAATVTTAQLALTALLQRRATRGQWIATAQELHYFDEALWLLEHVQLTHVSNKELTTAHQIVRNAIAGAKSGSPGRVVVHSDSFDD